MMDWSGMASRDRRPTERGERRASPVRQRGRGRHCALAGLLLVLALSTPGRGQQRTSVFNEARPYPLRQVTEDDYVKDWYGAPVTRGTGMFSPLFLPFQYVVKGGTKDPKQPLTFPSLLSLKFDFVPDNFSSRHPAFVYRRDQAPLSIRPGETEKIASHIREWDGTHCIGGTLVQHEKGYSGSMLVYNADGEQILSVDYKQPMPYFELMGRMVESWMKFRRQEVGPDLLKELLRPMTRKLRLVRVYGLSFDFPQWSKEEWNVYETILEQDPDFGEVQWWYANQKQWATRNYKEGAIGKGKALTDHIVVSALREFYPKLCSDKALVQNFHEKLAYAEGVLGNHPTILAKRIELSRSSFTQEDLDDLLPVAQAYPCHYVFLHELGHAFHKREQYEKSIPLYLSAVRSGFLTAVHDFDNEYCKLAYGFYALGYLAESKACCDRALADCSEENRKWFPWMIGLDLQDSLDFVGAATWFRKREVESKKTWCGFHGRMTLYEGGRLDTLAQWDAAPQDKKLVAWFGRLLNARKCLAEGKHDEVLLTLVKMTFDPKKASWLQMEADIIRADALLCSGDTELARQHAHNAWCFMPRSRRVAFLIERAAGDDVQMLGRFAGTAGILFPKQAFWQDMVGRAKARGYQPDSPETILSMYADLKTRLGGVAAQEERAFWAAHPAFHVEHLARSLMGMAEGARQENALTLYMRYARSMAGLSRFQKVHGRAFFRHLLLGLPAPDRPAWMAQFDAPRE